MGIVIPLLSFVLILTCLLLALLVLIQLPKKEAGFGMAFGAGAVDTLLGAGAGNALTKITKWVGGVFLGLCILLSFLNSRVNSRAAATKSVRDAAAKAAAATPAAPVTLGAGASNTAAPALTLPATPATNLPAAK
jgi:preprotein translocase subunit SecG